MTTTAATWFYSTPEDSAYFIEERVNQTFWQARVFDILLDSVTTKPPFKMKGLWRNSPIRVEWKPNEYFILKTAQDQDASDLVQAISRVIALTPSFSCINNQTQLVTEWHTDGGNERWQKLQGKPAFSDLKRL